MSEFKRTEREKCRHYDGDSGCLLNRFRWCMPFGRCAYFKIKNTDGKKSATNDGVISLSVEPVASRSLQPQ